MKIDYEVLSSEQISDAIRKTFADALKEQGKVKGNLLNKADRCKLLCIARINGIVAGIGAIKLKTQSDFSSEKANLPNINNDFEWELGYLFTNPKHTGKGIAKTISQLLVDAHGSENLMASTELSANPAMVKILEKLGFRHYGQPWKSSIHGNDLGLFLKFR